MIKEQGPKNYEAMRARVDARVDARVEIEVTTPADVGRAAVADAMFAKLAAANGHGPNRSVVEGGAILPGATADRVAPPTFSPTGTPLVPIELAPVSLRDPVDPDDRAPPREWGSWQAPPRRRRNRISEARIGHGGGHKVHLTIDLTDDGRPCAIWVDVHKEGAVFRGMLSAIAALASQALQHGADVHEVTARMLGQRFEPDGAVEGHESVTECLSIVDLLGRMIEAEFPRDGAK